MKQLKTLSLATAMLLTAAAAQAQTGSEQHPFKPYAFLGFQLGGTDTHLTELTYKKWAPQGAVSLGGYVLPWLGGRVQANTFSWVERLGDFTLYDTYIGPNADVLLNLSSLLRPHHCNVLDVVLLGGGGMNYAASSSYFPTDDSKSRWAPSVKAGMQLNLNVARRWAVGVEGGAQRIFNHFTDTRADKWWPYVMAGVTYRLGRSAKPVVAPQTVPVVNEVADNSQANSGVAQPVVEQKKPQPVVEEKPVAPKAPETMTENVFFRIGSYAIGQQQAAVVARVAEWAKQHRQADIVLTGYADKATGNARLNQALSEKRAAAVKDALVKQGVEAARISTQAKGDTVQPFSQNNQNRVVIAVGEEK